MPKGHVKELSETFIQSSNQDGGSVKDVSNTLDILESPSVKTNPFGANISGSNSYRRAERIAAALHLITNHIAESEPLRAALRESGLRLLACILELRTGFRAPASEKGKSALAEIRSTISQVRILAVAGYISSPNARSVIDALDELGNLIVISQRSTLAEQVNLSRADLIPRAEFTYRTSMQQPPLQAGGSDPKKEHKKDMSKTSVSMEKIGDRGGRIMDILRAGGELGIKDIASNLPQYSEKMIQRELATLVDRKAIEKVGEKRWSKYRLIGLSS
jgi:hypothetical protein